MIKKSLKKPMQIVSLILAAMLAFLFWFNVTLNRKYDYTIQAPLKIIGIPPNISPVEPIPEFINVHIQDIGKNLLKLILSEKKNDIVVRIPLPNPVVGENTIPVQKENIFWPADYSQPYHHLDKGTITIRLYPDTQKEVPVRAGFIPNLKRDHIVVGNVRIEPERVVAQGPSYNLKKLNLANVVFDSKSEFSDTLRIKLPLSETTIYNIRFIPDSVLVTIPIQREAVKLVESVPVRLINVPANLEGKLIVNPAYMSIEVSAGEAIIDDISARDFNVFIDYSAIGREELENDVPAVVNPFKEINRLRSFPEKFRIIAKEKQN